MPRPKKQEVPLDNLLVPQHRIMTEEETQKLLDTYNVTKDKLPKILITDPAIQHLNPKIGDVIEITRNDYVGKYLYYRVVVAP